jgi:hypothetical protein
VGWIAEKNFKSPADPDILLEDLRRESDFGGERVVDLLAFFRR